MTTFSPSGSLQSKIAIVAEAPGPYDRDVILSGKTASILWSLLSQHGIKREECYVTSVHKKKVSRMNFSPFYKDKKNTEPTPTLECIHNDLLEELSHFKGNVILAIGQESLFALTRNKGITNWRGSIIDTCVGKVIPTISPSMVVRNYDFLPRLSFDISRLVEESEFPEVILPDHELIIGEKMSDLLRCDSEIREAEYLSFDIETIEHHIDCIGFSWAPDKGLSIPLCKTSGEPYWSQLDEERIWVMMAEWLENPQIKKIAQNATYDITYLQRYGIRVNNLWLDTMNAHHAIYPEFPKGLDFLVSIYTKFPYHKDKIGISRLEYNALDAITTYHVAMAIEEELKKFGTHSFYHNFINKLIIPYMEVQNGGILCDLKVRREALEDIENQISRVEKQIVDISGRPINPNSPKQLQEYFYEEKGYHKYVNRKTKRPTTNEDALLRIKRRYDDPLVDPILEMRGLIKSRGFISTKTDCDGRIRTAYIISGTTTGRLASKEHVYGSGTNLQNIPRGIPRQMFIPDEGHVFIGADLSQAEARIVAYLSQDSHLMELYSERGRDIHSENAARIFGGTADMYPSGTDERQIAKTTTHAANYDISFRSFSLAISMPENEGKRILEGYHSTYPGIRRWHRSVVDELRRSRTLITPFGRKRQFFGRWGDDTFKMAYNFIPQSTVADLINKGFLAFYHHPDRKRLGAKIVLQIHDAIYVQAPEEVSQEVASLLVSCMEIPFFIHDNELLIPADVSIGKNWNET